MRIVKKLAVLALAIGFLAAPVAQANANTESRTPAAAQSKKKKKAKGAKGRPDKKSAKKAGKKAGAGKRKNRENREARPSRPKSHAPTQAPAEYDDISNEKKDDLPPPITVDPSDD